ncbi:serine/threonine-protein kinase RIPK-like isoform X3 [Rhododendron vialii]|uniref:serine/threonine-protein kinase RIPK-like isoform X3 n=1 Tax=Rhododendron vialii TaxID=182163 RepID=UPI00265F6C00|nr:serine/threonine-protein kinase RIPK-like isoform X3 [Rhododendron vialii]
MASEIAAPIALMKRLSINPDVSDLLAIKLGSRREHFTKPFEFTSEQICTFTDMFDKRNLIGPTQFGEVYRGKICEGMSGSKAKNVIVKRWDEKSDPLVGKDEYLMVKEEVMFLTDASVVDHPNLVNVIGYCCDEQVRGVVYDLDPVDTLHNMMLKDDFTWLRRIKVALGFLRLLEFLHGHDKPYLVFNIDACHIMLDQEFNPILFDFGLMSGGIIGELSYPKKFIYMSLGYVDPFFVDTGMRHDLSCDVFSYGVILIELIAKIAIDLEKSVKLMDLPDERAKLVYKPGFSLVQESLEKDPGYDATDGPMISNLAMRCVEYFPENRPTMKEVVEQLEGLRVVKLHGDGLGPSN